MSGGQRPVRRPRSIAGRRPRCPRWRDRRPHRTQRRLEVACMLALEPTVLLLDEPASGISQAETEALGPLLRRIKDQTGSTILLIEHDMPLVMGLSDWVYCLDAGGNLSDGTPADIQ